MTETRITINLTISTTDLKEMFPERLNIYFNGLERVMKLAASICNAEVEIRTAGGRNGKNNGHLSSTAAGNQ